MASESPGPRFGCPVAGCGKTYDLSTRLSTHWNQKHSGEPIDASILTSLDLARCSTCQFVYTTRGLSQHRRMAHGDCDPESNDGLDANEGDEGDSSADGAEIEHEVTFHDAPDPPASESKQLDGKEREAKHKE